MSNPLRITGYFRSESVSFALTDGVAPVVIALDDDDYFPDELAAEIQSKVIASHANYANFLCSVSTSTGIFSMVLGAGETALIAWDSDSTILRDWMRYSGVSTSLSDVPNLGSRVHKVGVYLAHTAEEDLFLRDAPSTQTRTDNGQVNTVAYATRAEHRIGILFQGPPRQTSYTEYDAVEEFFIDHLQLGRRYRFYPDRTVTTVFAKVSNPFGYHTLVGDLPIEFDPSPVKTGWYQWFRHDWRSFVYVAP
jgi:hypothetical protein